MALRSLPGTRSCSAACRRLPTRAPPAPPLGARRAQRTALAHRQVGGWRPTRRELEACLPPPRGCVSAAGACPVGAKEGLQTNTPFRGSRLALGTVLCRRRLRRRLRRSFSLSVPLSPVSVSEPEEVSSAVRGSPGRPRFRESELGVPRETGDTTGRRGATTPAGRPSVRTDSPGAPVFAPAPARGSGTPRLLAMGCTGELAGGTLCSEGGRWQGTPWGIRKHPHPCNRNHRARVCVCAPV